MAINIQTTGEQTVGLLRRTELRKFLTEVHLEELGRHCRASRRKARSVVHRENDPADALYWVVEGAAELRARPPGRRAYRTVEVVGRGCIFGEESVFGEGSYLFGSRVLEPVRLLVLPRWRFQRLTESHPEIAIGILACAGSCLVETVRRAAILTQAPADVGLRLLLKDLAQDSGAAPGRPVRLRLTHAQLAGVLHLSRETVSRMLGKLADQGKIELGRGVVRVKAL